MSSQTVVQELKLIATALVILTQPSVILLTTHPRRAHVVSYLPYAFNCLIKRGSSQGSPSYRDLDGYRPHLITQPTHHCCIHEQAFRFHIEHEQRGQQQASQQLPQNSQQIPDTPSTNGGPLKKRAVADRTRAIPARIPYVRARRRAASGGYAIVHRVNNCNQNPGLGELAVVRG